MNAVRRWGHFLKACLIAITVAAAAFVVLSTAAGAMAQTRSAAQVTAAASTSEQSNYWLVASDGGVFSFGTSYLGSTGGTRLNRPIVTMASTPSGKGYWLVASDGGIFAFGDARFFGSTGAVHLNQPIVGMARTPSGNGYWLVASDGGIFAFGDATFFGSAGATRLNQPIVGMAETPSGNGYWLVASDGGIFAFGDAHFYGSTGAIKLNQPIVAMAATPTGNGYWLAASDGGIFAFGDAHFYGSTGAIKLNQPIVGIARSASGGGYLLVASDGGIFAFGDAHYYGSTGALRLNSAIVAMAIGASSGNWGHQMDVNGVGYTTAVAADGGAYYGGETVPKTQTVGAQRYGVNVGFVARYDELGNQIWLRELGDWTTVTGIAPTPSGDVLAVGSALENVAEFSWDTRALIAKLDATGQVLWSKHVADFTDVYGYNGAGNLAVALDAGGSFYVSGNDVLARYDSNGNLIWKQRIGKHCTQQRAGVALDGQGHVFVACKDSDFNGDLLIAKYDTGGTQLWLRSLGSPGTGLGIAGDFGGIHTDTQGNVYAAGTTLQPLPDAPEQYQSAQKAFVAKLDGNGTTLWVHQLGTAATQSVTLKGSVMDAAGNLIVVGQTNAILPGSGASTVSMTDTFLAQYDSAGNRVWVRQFGPATGSQVLGENVAATNDGLYVTGEVRGTIPGGSKKEIDPYDNNYDPFLLRQAR